MSAAPPDPQGCSASPEIETPTPEIDLSIYAMPAFATLSVSDLDASRRWYVEGLGFVVLAQIPGPAGEVMLIHLRRWRYQDLLLVPAGDTGVLAPEGIRLTFAAHGADLDALAAQARAAGGGDVEGPVTTSWNTRDVITRDPDGYVVVFTAVRPPDQRDPEFSRLIERVSERMLAERAAPPD